MSDPRNPASISPVRMAIEWGAVYAIVEALLAVPQYSSLYAWFPNASEAASFVTAAGACVLGVAFGVLGWRSGLGAAQAGGLGALKLAVTLALSGAPSLAREAGIPFVWTPLLLSVATVPVSLAVFAEFDRRFRSRRVVLGIAPLWMAILAIRGLLPWGAATDFLHGFAFWAILQVLFYAHLGYAVASQPVRGRA